MSRYTSIGRRCHCKNRSDESQVNSRLAITPAQMQSMTLAGKSVAVQSLEGVSYYDNSPSVDDMPLEYVRGIDDNDLWNASLDSKRKLKDFRKKKQSDDTTKKGGM